MEWRQVLGGQTVSRLVIYSYVTMGLVYLGTDRKVFMNGGEREAVIGDVNDELMNPEMFISNGAKHGRKSSTLPDMAAVLAYLQGEP